MDHPFKTAKHFAIYAGGVLAALFLIRLIERTVPTLGPMVGAIESGTLSGVVPTSTGG